MALSRRQRLIRFLEFLVIGIVMGLVEDLLALWLATDAAIDLRVVLIVLAVAVPFAALSELLVDHPRFWEVLLPRSWFPAHWIARRRGEDAGRDDAGGRGI